MALKKWMVRQGLSAEELAKAVGVSRQAVYAWIAGEYPPSTSNLAIVLVKPNLGTGLMDLGSSTSKRAILLATPNLSTKA